MKRGFHMGGYFPQAGRALKEGETKRYFFETISPIFGLGAAKELMCASEA